MTITLPLPIADYINADNAGDANGLAQCFTDNAAVRDEGRLYQGRPAIEAWSSEAKAKYQYRIAPLKVVESDGRTVVACRLSGNFPGSPVEVDFAFRLADGKIAGLQIGT